MALNYIYSDAPLSTIDITDRCRTYVLSVTDRAEEGSVAISNLVIDDPDGDLTITGHRRLYIFEDTAPVGDQVIFNGFVVNERLIRGPSGRTEASRQWVVDLADVNVLINRRIMNGADANRPAETDLERIQALLTMTELNTVDDDSFVNTTAATVDMDAVDYRGQNVGQYIDDCRQQSGKNAYIYYNETLGEYGLWYDFDYSTEYDSGRYLSNIVGEADGESVFHYSQERTYLNVDPSRVASGIYLEYSAGLVYVQDPATTDEFAAIDWAAPSLNVKTSAKATARANRYLADAATEDYIVHVVMTAVPRAQVNAVKKGQLVQFKSSYMTPWYDGYTSFRVLYRTVNEISEDPNASFEIEMDLTPVTLPPAPPCDTITAEGNYPPNLSAVSAGTGNVIYTKTGHGAPVGNGFIPAPGYVGQWGFPLYDSPSHADYAGDCNQNQLICVVQGDGTIEIQTLVFLPQRAILIARLQHEDALGNAITDETQYGITPGELVTFNVSSHGGAFCNHRVMITDNGGGGSCGSKWGFWGFDWTPTP